MERHMAIGLRTARTMIGAAIIMAAAIMTTKPASATEIHVMSGGAPQEALAVLTPEFEQRTGHQVKYTFAVLTALRQRIDAGEKPDMVLMPVPMIESYVKAGKMRPDGRAVLGNVGTVVIVKQGAPLPDISTPEHFRDALLHAAAIVHATPTATPSGAHMAKVIERLGIANDLKKVIHRPALDGGVELVAKGEAEIGIYPASEVAKVKGITVVGPLPTELQLNTLYGAAVMTDNATPEPALAFVKFLSDPANRARWKEAGFDPPEN
jgi:molybdate transport system substrate-binding protein